MSNPVSHISFRIRHPSMDASAIEAAVGQTAKVKWTVGEPRVTPKGASLTGIRNDTYCVFEIPESIEFPVNEAIISAVERLSLNISDLNGLSANGAAIEFYVTVDRSVRGEMIEAATISAMNRLNAGLAIDWFN